MDSQVKKLVGNAKIAKPADIYASLPKGPFKYDPRLTKSQQISLNPDRLVGYVQSAIDGASEEGAAKVCTGLELAEGLPVQTGPGRPLRLVVEQR